MRYDDADEVAVRRLIEAHVDSRDAHPANERTALQEAVLRAAVAFCQEEKTSTFLELEDAVDALLAAEPAWGKGK